MKELKIYNQGTNVVIKISEQIAIITATVIRFDNVSYELTYHYQGTYLTVWCNEMEFEAKNNQTSRVGFK